MSNFLHRLVLLAALGGGLVAAAQGQATAAPLQPPGPEAPSAAPGTAPRDAASDARREYWRSLSPEQRESIRRLSQEERQSLINRGQARPGEAPPSGRLSREERRQLRAQIREEHERRGSRAGGGRRP